MNFIHHHLGLISYDEAMDLQKKWHEQVCLSLKNNRTTAFLLTLEHPPVITLGKNAALENILRPPEFLRERGWQVVRSERGGEVTLHEPGQLVVYFIAPLSCFDFSVRKFIGFLVSSVQDVLSQDYGIQSHYNPAFPGLWVDEAKFAAIGVRVKNKVSLHGMAINLNNDLNSFNLITPCGIKDKRVSSLSQILGKDIDVHSFLKPFLIQFKKNLEMITE